MAAIDAAYKSDRYICFFSQKNARLANPEKDDLYQVGTLGKVERILHTESEVHAWIKGEKRIKLLSLEATEPFLVGKVIEIDQEVTDSEEIQALSNNLVKEFQKSINLGKTVDVMSVMRLFGENSPSELADQIAYVLELNTGEKQQLLEMISINERLGKDIELLAKENKVLELEKMINSKTQKQFDKSMRETVLRERDPSGRMGLGQAG